MDDIMLIHIYIIMYSFYLKINHRVVEFRIIYMLLLTLIYIIGTNGHNFCQIKANIYIVFAFVIQHHGYKHIIVLL